MTAVKLILLEGVVLEAIIGAIILLLMEAMGLPALIMLLVMA